MKKMKRFMAAALAMTFLFTTSVMAQTPREILSQAYANSADATTMSMTGNIAGTIYMMGMELLTLNVDIHMDMDVDLDTGELMMYMRLPMQISGIDPLSGAAMNENLEVAMFMDGTRVLLYESRIGWFTDPSMYLDGVDIMGGMNLEELEQMTAWFLEINEQIMDDLTIQFAADQVAGYYVVETFMDWDDMMNMIGAILTPEFFEGIFAFMPEEDLDPREIEMAIAEIEGMLNMLNEIAEIDLEVVYRSYIDVETLHFQRYLMDMDLTFTAELEGIELSGNFTMNFDVDYDPTIVWPVITEVAALEDVLAAFGIQMTSLEFGQANLEVRDAVMIDGVSTAIIVMDIEDIANFNVFIVNHGLQAVSIILDGVFNEVLQPGEGFVMQVPMGTLSGQEILVIDGRAIMNVETGFRLTNMPLGYH